MRERGDLISDAYRTLNMRLHADGSYGRRGDKWAGRVREIIARCGAATVLDYGCGQGALARALDAPVTEYDPAIPGKDAPPEAADLVVCTDVLEHVEPDRLDAVLAHLSELCRIATFAAISIRPARKTLADGRNAHLIVEDEAFWRARIAAHFEIVEWRVKPGDEIVCLLGPRRAG